VDRRRSRRQHNTAIVPPSLKMGLISFKMGKESLKKVFATQGAHCRHRREESKKLRLPGSGFAYSVPWTWQQDSSSALQGNLLLRLEDLKSELTTSHSLGLACLTGLSAT